MPLLAQLLRTPTLLHCAFTHTHTTFPRVEGQALTDLRNTPWFVYIPKPDKALTRSHQSELCVASPSSIHILLYATVIDRHHITIHRSTVSQGCVCGRDRMQALSQAVYTSFHDVIPHLPVHTLIWIRDSGYPEKLLTLSPSSNYSFTEMTRHLLTHYLHSIPDSST